MASFKHRGPLLASRARSATFSLALALTLSSSLGCPRSANRQENSATSPQRRKNSSAWPSFETVSARLRPSVVSVITVSQRPARGPKTRWGMASGVVVSSKKQILTNAHALEGANEIYIQQGTRPHLRARIIARDPRVDLALLELIDPPPAAKQDWVPITWRESEAVPGQWAICMGHPYGLGHTVTVGVVSGRGRDYDDMGQPAGLDPQGWWSMLQIDAAINVGNSGGPVVDRKGHAIGIATATRTDGQGLAFAIPARMARHFVTEVQMHGQLRQVRLGAKIQETGPGEVPGRLQSLRVIAVTPGSPADRAGLKPDDILLRTDTRELHRLSALAFELHSRGPGATLTLWVKPLHATAPQMRELSVTLSP